MDKTQKIKLLRADLLNPIYHLSTQWCTWEATGERDNNYIGDYHLSVSGTHAELWGSHNSVCTFV